MRWSLPLPRVRPQISKSSLTFTHHPITHSPHPLKSYIHLLLPKHNAIILALIIRFHHHTNLLHNLSASTYLKTAFNFLKVWFALLKCKFILYTWNEYNMSTMLIKEESQIQKKKNLCLFLLKRRTILLVYPMYHVKAYLPPFPGMNHKLQQTGHSKLQAPPAYSNAFPSIQNSPLAHLVKILVNHTKWSLPPLNSTGLSLLKALGPFCLMWRVITCLCV